jgi:Zn-dependent peptidase ImmA (M78 family)
MTKHDAAIKPSAIRNQRDADAARLARAMSQHAHALNSGPVNIEQMALRVTPAIKSVQRVSLPTDGMLAPIGDDMVVFVNSRHSAERQRFTIAHEIAHAILEPGSLAHRQISPSPDKALENRCDHLASLMLMPDPQFTNELRRLKPSIATVQKLSRSFFTSIQATALRVIDSASEPLVLLVSAFSDGKSGRRLRVKWFKYARLEDGASQFIPKNASVNISSALTAYQTPGILSEIEDIVIGRFRINARVESKGFGQGNTRYVLSLVYPDRR